MRYADYDYYCSEFKGRLIASAEEFDSLEVKARAYVDKITFGRAKAVCDTESVKNAVCAACEVYQTYGAREGISSENNDGYSVTYVSNSSQVSNRLKEVAQLYLPAELLYRGIDA